MEDLTETIENAISDATLPTPEVDLDTPSEALEASPEPSEVAHDPEPSIEVPNPVARAEEAAKAAPTDDFDKKFGLTANSPTGRENRIPYTRVKKITEKAVNDAKAAWSKEVETGYVPTAKFVESEAKVKDYEGRLTQVAEFEKVMANDQVRFLQMLYKQPGYKELFDQLVAPSPQTQAVPTHPDPIIDDDGPQPDEQLADGTAVYSMKGLKALRAWDRQKVTDAVVKQIEARYAPIESSFQSYQKVQSVIPQVQKQIDEARTWPLFNESEADIVKALQTNPNLSLERAYQSVVYPKMKSEQDRLADSAKVNKDAVRAEILKELKQAPHSTSAASTTNRPVQVSAGPRSIEDVIMDSIKGLKS